MDNRVAPIAMADSDRLITNTPNALPYYAMPCGMVGAFLHFLVLILTKSLSNGRSVLTLQPLKYCQLDVILCLLGLGLGMGSFIINSISMFDAPGIRQIGPILVGLASALYLSLPLIALLQVKKEGTGHASEEANPAPCDTNRTTTADEHFNKKLRNRSGSLIQSTDDTLLSWMRLLRVYHIISAINLIGTATIDHEGGMWSGYFLAILGGMALLLTVTISVGQWALTEPKKPRVRFCNAVMLFRYLVFAMFLGATPIFVDVALEIKTGNMWGAPVEWSGRSLGIFVAYVVAAMLPAFCV